jgi:hypothetical protein
LHIKPGEGINEEDISCPGFVRKKCLEERAVFSEKDVKFWRHGSDKIHS